MFLPTLSCISYIYHNDLKTQYRFFALPYNVTTVWKELAKFHTAELHEGKSVYKVDYYIKQYSTVTVKIIQS